MLAVAGQMHDGGDAGRRDRAHLGGQVTGVVDDVGRAEAAHELLFSSGPRRGDHLGARGHRELQRKHSHPARGAGDQDGLTGGG